MMVILAIAGDFLINVIKNQNVMMQRDELSRQARFAIDDLVHDLRSANSNDPNVDPITTLGSQTMVFYSPDRQSTFHLQKIKYRLNGTNLERSVTKSTNTAAPWTFPTDTAYKTVIPDVQSLTFTYKDSSNTTTTLSSKVQRVQIAMTVDNDPTHSPYVQSYNLTVDLRITNE